MVGRSHRVINLQRKMSGIKKIQCELPTKPWNNYSSDEIRRYCFTNFENTDCSFIAEDEKDNKAKMVYESFKWILWQMSLVLKEILNDKENLEKDCKQIVVSNANHIEAILVYAHFKVVDTKIMDLVDFYGASKEYQVKTLEDEVIKMFESEENQKNANWVKLFWLSYVKYPEDQQMRAIFEKVKGHVNSKDKFAEANIDFILKFNRNYFDIFFHIMVGHWHTRKLFKITEAYLIKYFFDGDKNKKLEDVTPFQRSLVEWYINKMNLIDGHTWNEYKNGPLASNLLTTKRKIEHLEIIEKYYSTNPANYRTILGEIQSYTQKLREAECNLKTENKP